MHISFKWTVNEKLKVCLFQHFPMIIFQKIHVCLKMQFWMRYIFLIFFVIFIALNAISSIKKILKALEQIFICVNCLFWLATTDCEIRLQCGSAFCDDWRWLHIGTTSHLRRSKITTEKGQKSMLIGAWPIFFIRNFFDFWTKSRSR